MSRGLRSTPISTAKSGHRSRTSKTQGTPFSRPTPPAHAESGHQGRSQKCQEPQATAQKTAVYAAHDPAAEHHQPGLELLAAHRSLHGAAEVAARAGQHRDLMASLD